MSSTKSNSHSGNQGIVGNVTADVLAVGDHATAYKVVNLTNADRTELQTSVQQLQAAIAALQLPTVAHQALTTDIATLHQEVKADKPDKEKVQGILGGIAGKLKMVVDMSKDAASLIEPFTKIAGILHISLAAIGLL